MLRSINIRSFLIGGLLVFSVMCLMGTASNVSSEYHGRFKIATNPDHAFVLDSATGQVWSQYFPLPENVIGAPPDEFHSPKLSIGSHVIENGSF